MKSITLVVLLMGIGQLTFAAPTESDRLDKPLPSYKESRTGRGLNYFCAKVVQMPCGEELLPSSAQEPSKAAAYLHLKDTTPRKILDELVAELPDSRWEIRSGVINVEPRNLGDDPLGTKVPEFTVHGVSSLLAALDLFEDAGIEISYEEMGHRRQFGTIDIDLKNVSVREALNAIVKADGELMWVFSHSNNPKSQSKGTLVFFSTRTTGKTFSEEWKKTKRWKREHGGQESKQPGK